VSKVAVVDFLELLLVFLLIFALIIHDQNLIAKIVVQNKNLKIVFNDL